MCLGIYGTNPPDFLSAFELARQAALKIQK